MEKIEFTRNALGVLIKKCCASCKHKKFDKIMRICDKDKGKVSPGYICADWEMNKTCEKAGIGGGKVKKKSYLMYVINYEQPSDLRNHVSLGGMRKEYEDKYDTIYTDI